MYITVDEVKTRFPSIEAEIERGTLTEARLSTWIDSAEALINSYLSKRYSLPFDSVPPIVTSLSYELVEFYWQKGINTPTSSGDEVPWLYKRYDRIIAQLERIVNGEEALVDDEGEEVEVSDALLKNLKSNHQEVDQIFRITKPSWEQEIDDDYDKEPEI